MPRRERGLGHLAVGAFGVRAEFAPALERLAPGDARVITAADVDDLWPRLQPRLAPDAAILLKASRGVKLERIVPLLTHWATG